MSQDRINRIVDEALARETAIQPGRSSEISLGEATENLGAMKKIALGSDHGGFQLKQALAVYLKEKGFRIYDLGTDSEQAVDYPDFALKVARAVASGKCDAGIMVDGAGIGSCMAANKVRGIRAAMCYDQATARNSREHNNANLLTLGGKMLDEDRAKEVVEVWLKTPFAGGRHWPRVNKIMRIENTRG